MVGIYLFYFVDNLGCPGQRSVDTHDRRKTQGFALSR
jgi:hypothetical protein